ncbi:MAG: hypothetical protein MUE79_05545 [Nitratireductor sp.]|jgi:hypothetical protein|nr:hypothetical protein [Nitratireductor sp.]
MDPIREAAHFCIGRAVGFGGLAISVVMVSCAFDFTLALRMGLILTLAMTAILFWMFQTVGSRKPERSEVWLTLPVDERPNNDAARAAFKQIMEDTYLFYTIRAFGFSMLLLALWVCFAIASFITGEKIGLT